MVVGIVSGAVSGVVGGLVGAGTTYAISGQTIDGQDSYTDDVYQYGQVQPEQIYEYPNQAPDY